MELSKVAIKAAKDRVKLVETWMEADRAKTIAEAKMKAIDEYKASPDFETEVMEESTVAYMFGF